MIREGWAVQNARGHYLSNDDAYEPEAELAMVIADKASADACAEMWDGRAVPIRLRVEVVPYAPEQRHGPTCLCGECVDKG